MRRKYHTGDKIAHLTVLEYLGEGNYKCKCDCGNEDAIDARKAAEKEIFGEYIKQREK